MATELATRPALSEKAQLKNLIVERMSMLPDGTLVVENRLYQKAVHDLGMEGVSIPKFRDALDSLGFESGPNQRVERFRKPNSWAVLIYRLV